MIKSTLSTPPSSFRLNRLQRLAERRDEFRLLLAKVANVNKIVRKWYAARKVNTRGPDFFRHHKLDQHDPLYQQFTLSALKTAEWGKSKPAEVFYALLCEATHPNVGAAGLYVDTTTTAFGRRTHRISKVRNSQEVYDYVFNLVCRPSIECVNLLDKLIAEARTEKLEIERFARKIRQVT